MKIKLKVLLMLPSLIVYMIIGAVIFMKLEKKDEPNREVANRILKAVQDNLSLQFGVNITDLEFRSIVENISEAVAFNNTPDWTFWKSIDFTLIALTTIGYGDFAPRTPIGQGVFIIYAMIGLPLTIVTLKYTGELLRKCVKKTILVAEKKVFRKKEHKHVKIKCFIVSLLLFVSVHGLGATVFHIFDSRSLLEGFYGTFVTLSTIGFGDYRIPLDMLAIKYGSLGKVLMLLLELPIFLAALTTVSCFLNSSIVLLGKARHKIHVRKIQRRSTKSIDITTKELSFQELSTQIQSV